MISQEQLKKVMAYDASTGVFTYRIDKGRHKAGNVAGWMDLHGYLNVMLFGKFYKLHRLAWLYVYGEIPKEGLDHINRVKTDNRISNLRIACSAKNSRNKRAAYASNKEGVLGVWFRKDRGVYTSQICIAGVKISLGCFVEREDAERAYLEAKQFYHPEAFTN